MNYNELAISNTDELIFGTAPKPVKCGNGLVIGNGTVYPEINFTLPTMLVDSANWKEILNQYSEIMKSLSGRSEKLKVPGFVVEFEQLPPMTMNPEWGGEITALIKKELDLIYERTGIPNALRVTVVDLRDADRPPLLRKGGAWQKTRRAFIEAAKNGADILSIESVGGKEVHDQALMYGDLNGITASLGCLAYRDVAWLWKEITSIADEYGIVSGGDTACGFSNTAMQLAGQGMLPNILAAIDRAASAPRSLAAFENGAVGPSKDCAYEGPIIKAIAGVPISMEGKSSCCAHFSPLGNIASAAADLWSNESVQNIRLLSGNAPEAFFELLAYDCRLMNESLKSDPRHLRDLMVQSDIRHNVQALMLEPETVIDIARAIVKEKNGYRQTVAAVTTAFEAISKAHESGRVAVAENEIMWLDDIGSKINDIPATEEEAVEYLKNTFGDLFLPEAYDIK
jgi:methanol--5-hydroxybenzimidazolylcobamide Co-methyltransferase